ncbi:MAG: dUTP diphosphatase [Nesterenkonia sp.]|nr:dUTP diphosphatase [Nesterenkonia sp.]
MMNLPEPTAQSLRVPLRRLDPDLPVPGYAHRGDAGADLVSAEDFTLGPGRRRLVPTGVALALPTGWVGLVHPRSGLAVRHGVGLVNAPGTVDAGYRGEIKVCLINHDPTAEVTFRRGDRIAQLVIQQVAQAEFVVVEELEQSARGEGGFGSTGTTGAAGQTTPSPQGAA